MDDERKRMEQKLRAMIVNPKSYFDALSYRGKYPGPQLWDIYTPSGGQNTEEAKHAKHYNDIVNYYDKFPHISKKAGGEADVAKNYVGGLDWASRVPEKDAREMAELYQMFDYLKATIKGSPQGQWDAVNDLIENLKGIDAAAAGSKAQHNIYSDGQTGLGWARRNPRPEFDR